MMLVPLLTVALNGGEGDVVAARQRARQLAELLGYERQDQTRIATAVSEIARNTSAGGGMGRIDFGIEKDPPHRLVVHVRNRAGAGDGGVAEWDEAGAGDGGVADGFVGARRLMDDFAVSSTPGKGTVVMLAKRLPRSVAPPTPARLAQIAATLNAPDAPDLLREARTQHRELLESLAALKAKQEETERLNIELEETNRGVVALYAELDQKARELAELNTALEDRVAVAVADVQRANEALRQSQKMEAVGQLTGGIAHDFNNLLQIVTGNLEMLTRSLPADATRLRRAADNAMSGAERAATLTQRLLAFSRRQPLAPRPLDPNRLVEGMSDLMRRTLGETVNVRTDLAEDLWPVEADANQLENALLNLAVNARDAMAPGGTLTITTANHQLAQGDAADDVVPGDYVSLSVCDTGTGMSAETMSRVLEPFFTTKEVGKGTGLGLSMVYGFTKQSGGHLRLRSQLGEGSTVSIFLPRLVGPVPTGEHVVESAIPPARPGETVLVVEDNDDVRSHSCDALRDLGYQVLEASDGDAAKALLDGGARIDILFTDVVLAGALTGRDVARHCQAARAGTPVLFTSGYAHDTIGHQRLDPGVELLAKPFSYAALARRIRALLDGAPPGSAD